MASKFIAEIPASAGKVVGVTTREAPRGSKKLDVIIACEYAVYLLDTRGDLRVVVPIATTQAE